ncbi:MAG: hypothetical protein SV062_14260 [Thermodesulfobacteriota bacterium]|nr:hypothetical protein [Thermodesulfobacteriota bacterium]
MRRGVISKLIRGKTYFINPGGGFPHGSLKNGLIFGDTAGNIYLEYYTTYREKVYEIVNRNPFVELMRTVNKKYMNTLFDTIVDFSRHAKRGKFVAGQTFEFNKRKKTVRIREIARDLSTNCSAVIKSIMNQEIKRVSKVLGAERIVTETFDAYGKNLLKDGWKMESRGIPLIIRLGAWLNGNRCYSLDLKEIEVPPVR